MTHLTREDAQSVLDALNEGWTYVPSEAIRSAKQILSAIDTLQAAIDAPEQTTDDDNAMDAAWKVLKPQLLTYSWTASDSFNYRGFFAWGWEARRQYTAPQPPAHLLQQIAEFGELQNLVPQVLSVEQATVALIDALRLSKGWTTDYANAIVRDAIDRTAPQARELSDSELLKMWLEAVQRAYAEDEGEAHEFFARAVLAARSGS